jgi:hypothetical protein
MLQLFVRRRRPTDKVRDESERCRYCISICYQIQGLFGRQREIATKTEFDSLRMVTEQQSSGARGKRRVEEGVAAGYSSFFAAVAGGHRLHPTQKCGLQHYHARGQHESAELAQIALVFTAKASKRS